MPTLRDIIDLILLDSRVLGQGQSPSNEDYQNCLTRMNMMVAEWAQKRWLLFHLVDYSLTSTGAVFYTVGPGGDFDTGTSQRPNMLEYVFFRQLIPVPGGAGPVDYPLEVLKAKEDYDAITLKQLSSWPQYAFLDSAFPLAKLFVTPVPQASIFAIKITVKMPLGGFASLDTVYNLPEEYKSALHYNTIVRMWGPYGKLVDPTIVGLAKNSLNTLRLANVQVRRLMVPREILRPGLYNIYSDRMY